MSKLDRRNQARQKQQVKHQERAQATSIFAGQNGAPRHVAVIPLSSDINTRAAIRQLNASVDIPDDISQDGTSRVRVDRFKQSMMYVPAKLDIIGAMDACRLADFVVLVLSAQQEVDEMGELLLRSIEGQGISNVLSVVQVCANYSRAPLLLLLIVASLMYIHVHHRDSTKSHPSRKGRKSLLR
jgi:pre-rRNA-processing protein TSR1